MIGGKLIHWYIIKMYSIMSLMTTFFEVVIKVICLLSDIARQRNTKPTYAVYYLMLCFPACADGVSGSYIYHPIGQVLF